MEVEITVFLEEVMVQRMENSQTVTMDYVNEGVRKARAYKLQRQQNFIVNPAVAIQEIQGLG